MVAMNPKPNNQVARSGGRGFDDMWSKHDQMIANFGDMNPGSMMK